MSVDALVFDAYGTLFDVQSVGGDRRDACSRPRRSAVATLARQAARVHLAAKPDAKPTQRREDFAAVTAHALELCSRKRWPCRCPRRRHRLLDAYLDLSRVPRRGAGAGARSRRCRRLILSNGTREMLEPLAAATGLARHLDAILSVDAAGIYKPSPRVYQLAVDAL